MKSFKQLITVGDSDIPSSSQLWFHLVNIGVLFIYLFIGYKVAMLLPVDISHAPQLIDSMIWFTGVISGIITSNKFANMLATLKLGNKDANNKSTGG